MEVHSSVSARLHPKQGPAIQFWLKNNESFISNVGITQKELNSQRQENIYQLG